jgi:hypothetical protein
LISVLSCNFSFTNCRISMNLSFRIWWFKLYCFFCIYNCRWFELICVICCRSKFFTWNTSFLTSIFNFSKKVFLFHLLFCLCSWFHNNILFISILLLFLIRFILDRLIRIPLFILNKVSIYIYNLWLYLIIIIRVKIFY